jgi:type II secretion system protein H
MERSEIAMVTLNTTTHRQTLVRGNTRRHHRSSRGFTLIEILMVVVILGIASAVVAPQLGSRSDIKVRAAARLLVADLMYAQNNAIAQQKWMYVRFDAAGETYSVMDGAGANATDTTRIIKHPVTKAEFTTKLGVATDRRLGDVRIKTATFNGVDTNYRPEFVIAFDELGVPYVYCYDLNNTNELLDGTVELECGKDTIQVLVERYTGEIKVQ